MGLFSLKPARTDAGPSDKQIEVVADLDALIAEPIGIRVLGKVHELKPISTSTFFKLYQVQAEMEKGLAKLRSKKALTRDHVIDGHFAIFSQVCDTLTRDDLDKMSNYQIAALLKLVIEMMTGETHAKREKKNP